jgi:hypothetical protein
MSTIFYGNHTSHSVCAKKIMFLHHIRISKRTCVVHFAILRYALHGLHEGGLKNFETCCNCESIADNTYSLLSLDTLHEDGLKMDGAKGGIFWGDLGFIPYNFCFFVMNCYTSGHKPASSFLKNKTRLCTIYRSSNFRKCTRPKGSSYFH